MPTQQETFDKVVKHLLTQNYQCVDEAGNCVYRDDKGGSCAAGCLIPDYDYHPKMEYLAIDPHRTTKNEATEAVLKEGHDLFLVCDLQQIHDENEPEKWLELLQAEATERGLIFNGK